MLVDDCDGDRLKDDDEEDKTNCAADGHYATAVSPVSVVCAVERRGQTHCRMLTACHRTALFE